jgi:hypothetical protein
MSKKRDAERDKAETCRLILDPDRAPYTGGVNWLGHGARGGKDAVIDYLLLDGATMDRLLEERGSEASVRSHFQSLKTLHDLPVTRGPDGKYRFDRTHLGIADPVAGEKQSAAPRADGRPASRYIALADYLEAQRPDHVRLTFQQVEEILGASLRRTTPDRVTNGKYVFDRDRVRTDTDPKPVPISPNAVIWERSASLT